MEIHCSICTKTNHTSDGQMIIVATFAQKYQAENVLFAIQQAHIIPVWSRIVPQKEILDKKFSHLQSLIIQLHGIKDILQLQSLYIESMCQENNALTVDVISSKTMQKEILEKIV